MISILVEQGTASIGVITDDNDNVGESQPADIKTIVQELQSQGILRSSVIIGLTSSIIIFTPAMLNKLKIGLGFDNVIPLTNDSTSREVRGAFELHAQPAWSRKEKL